MNKDNIEDAVLDRLKVENNLVLPVRCLEASESMTQEDKV